MLTLLLITDYILCITQCIADCPLFEQWLLTSVLLCSERKWLGEFGFSTMLCDNLTDEAAGENDRNTLSLVHIWLSPQLQPCYTGRNVTILL